MNDTPQTNAPEAPASLAVDTRGSDFQMKSYDIAPEDQQLANEIASFDPVYDTAGPTSFSGSVRLPETIKATGLPPHLRDPIMAQLANMPVDRRDAEEQRLVNAALYENSLGLRIAGGPGNGANTYQHAKFSLTFDIEEAERELIRIGTQLGEVERYDVIEGKPVAVEKLRGQQRAIAEAQHKLLLHKLDQLNGIEGQRRLQRALYEAVQERKSLAAQLDDDREARALGEKLRREKRIRERAEAYAKQPDPRF